MNKEFLLNPNLPENKVTDVVVSFNDKGLIEALTKLEINCIKIKEKAKLEPSISSHADVLIYYLGKGKFLADNSIECLPKCCEIVKSVDASSPYPNDCILNSVSIGDYLICNEKITSKYIIDSALKNNNKIIDVRQGYSKCSVCVIKKNTIITDDESIYRKTSQISDIDALLISKGSVLLKGQNYGFIGGASGLIDKDLLFFNGDLSSHKDFLAIKAFLDYHNVSYIDIKDKPLLDVGSIIPIMQKGS